MDYTLLDSGLKLAYIRKEYNLVKLAQAQMTGPPQPWHIKWSVWMQNVDHVSADCNNKLEYILQHLSAVRNALPKCMFNSITKLYVIITVVVCLLLGVKLVTDSRLHCPVGLILFIVAVSGVVVLN